MRKPPENIFPVSGGGLLQSPINSSDSVNAWNSAPETSSHHIPGAHLDLRERRGVECWGPVLRFELDMAEDKLSGKAAVSQLPPRDRKPASRSPSIDGGLSSLHSSILLWSPSPFPRFCPATLNAGGKALAGFDRDESGSTLDFLRKPAASTEFGSYRGDGACRTRKSGSIVLGGSLFLRRSDVIEKLPTGLLKSWN